MPKRPQFGRSANSRRGNSLIEFSLLLPWYVFLFVGSFDLGMYSYSLVALEEGVRMAALNASQSTSAASNSATAGQYVLGSIQGLPNIGTSVTTTSASPIVVTAALVNSGPDGAAATTVTAVYTTPQLIPIPGILPGQLTITRSVEMKVQ
jgi:Flp pilus assembly protein TadG